MMSGSPSNASSFHSQANSFDVAISLFSVKYNRQFLVAVKKPRPRKPHEVVGSGMGGQFGQVYGFGGGGTSSSEVVGGGGAPPSFGGGLLPTAKAGGGFGTISVRDRSPSTLSASTMSGIGFGEASLTPRDMIAPMSFQRAVSRGGGGETNLSTSGGVGRAVRASAPPSPNSRGPGDSPAEALSPNQTGGPSFRVTKTQHRGGGGQQQQQQVLAASGSINSANGRFSANPSPNKHHQHQHLRLHQAQREPLLAEESRNRYENIDVEESKKRLFLEHLDMVHLDHIVIRGNVLKEEVRFRQLWYLQATEHKGRAAIRVKSRRRRTVIHIETSEVVHRLWIRQKVLTAWHRFAAETQRLNVVLYESQNRPRLEGEEETVRMTFVTAFWEPESRVLVRDHEAEGRHTLIRQHADSLTTVLLLTAGGVPTAANTTTVVNTTTSSNNNKAPSSSSPSSSWSQAHSQAQTAVPPLGGGASSQESTSPPVAAAAAAPNTTKRASSGAQLPLEATTRKPTAAVAVRTARQEEDTLAAQTKVEEVEKSATSAPQKPLPDFPNHDAEVIFVESGAEDSTSSGDLDSTPVRNHTQFQTPSVEGEEGKGRTAGEDVGRTPTEQYAPLIVNSLPLGSTATATETKDINGDDDINSGPLSTMIETFDVATEQQQQQQQQQQQVGGSTNTESLDANSSSGSRPVQQSSMTNYSISFIGQNGAVGGGEGADPPIYVVSQLLPNGGLANSIQVFGKPTGDFSPIHHPPVGKPGKPVVGAAAAAASGVVVVADGGSSNLTGAAATSTQKKPQVGLHQHHHQGGSIYREFVSSQPAENDIRATQKSHSGERTVSGAGGGGSTAKETPGGDAGEETTRSRSAAAAPTHSRQPPYQHHAVVCVSSEGTDALSSGSPIIVSSPPAPEGGGGGGVLGCKKTRPLSARKTKFQHPPSTRPAQDGGHSRRGAQDDHHHPGGPPSRTLSYPPEESHNCEGLEESEIGSASTTTTKCVGQIQGGGNGGSGGKRKGGEDAPSQGTEVDCTTPIPRHRPPQSPGTSDLRRSSPSNQTGGHHHHQGERSVGGGWRSGSRQSGSSNSSSVRANGSSRSRQTRERDHRRHQKVPPSPEEEEEERKRLSSSSRARSAAKREEKWTVQRNASTFSHKNHHGGGSRGRRGGTPSSQNHPPAHRDEARSPMQQQQRGKSPIQHQYSPLRQDGHHSPTKQRQQAAPPTMQNNSEDDVIDLYARVLLNLSNRPSALELPEVLSQMRSPKLRQATTSSVSVSGSGGGSRGSFSPAYSTKSHQPPPSSPPYYVNSDSWNSEGSASYSTPRSPSSARTVGASPRYSSSSITQQHRNSSSGGYHGRGSKVGAPPPPMAIEETFARAGTTSSIFFGGSRPQSAAKARAPAAHHHHRSRGSSNAAAQSRAGGGQHHQYRSPLTNDSAGAGAGAGAGAATSTTSSSLFDMPDMEV